MDYYSSIQKNAFDLVLMRWMNLEPTTQSEVSQKEKDKYRILMHIHGIQKDGTDEPMCGAAVEMQTEIRLVDTVGKESSMEAHTLPHVKQPVGICCVTQGLRTGAL